MVQLALNEVRPLTGEPHAGDPHVWFGGGRGPRGPFLPLSKYLEMVFTTEQWDLLLPIGLMPPIAWFKEELNFLTWKSKDFRYKNKGLVYQKIKKEGQ